MAMKRLKHIHLVLILGISLLIPMLMLFSFYVDLSETVLISSGINFENCGDDDSLVYRKEFNVFVPGVSSAPFHSNAHFHSVSNLFFSSLAPRTQFKQVLRC
jgi:hypothetical protein